jgi:hypothetical protein
VLLVHLLDQLVEFTEILLVVFVPVPMDLVTVLVPYFFVILV